MERAIVGFEMDTEEAQWRARLDCGHRRHARHEPPWSERPAVVAEEGRRELVGRRVDCSLCDRLELPEDVVAYENSLVYDNDTVPAHFVDGHTAETGIWVRIDVLEGRLRYIVEPPVGQTFVLDPETSGVVAPEIAHRLKLDGPVRFQLTYFRRGPTRPDQ